MPKVSISRDIIPVRTNNRQGTTPQRSRKKISRKDRSIALDSCDVIPVKENHDVTPQRTGRKSSRRDQGIAVASPSPTINVFSSTPNGHKSSDHINISLNSPSSSFPSSQYSQEVAWEYTSPKLPRGSKAKEWKLTAKELLERLNQAKPSGSNEQLRHKKLLESFIAKLNDNTAVKKTENNKRQNRKRPRNVLENLNKQMDMIPGLSKDNDSVSKTRQGTSYTADDPADANHTSKLNTSTKSFLEGESSEFDSTEELWGDMDNSFIIQATQELESTIPPPDYRISTSQDEMSTIPETARAPKQHEKQMTMEVEKINDFLNHLANGNWDDDDDDTDDWDNGFIEDDALSMVPEEALSGTAFNEVDQQDVSVAPSAYNADTVVYHHTESNGSKKENELLGSFEDDSFEDDSLIFEPDVLSKIAEVEYLSQQPKCTPEEINKKKEEAIKRRHKKK